MGATHRFSERRQCAIVRNRIADASDDTSMAAALCDEAHAEAQRERYANRRSVLWAAFTQAGWTVEHSEAGLYLWLTHPGHDGWSAAELLAAECGILVTPGSVYGPGGARYVRAALTATDERVAAAAARLAALRPSPASPSSGSSGSSPSSGSSASSASSPSSASSRP